MVNKEIQRFLLKFTRSLTLHFSLASKLGKFPLLSLNPAMFQSNFRFQGFYGCNVSVQAYYIEIHR